MVPPSSPDLPDYRINHLMNLFHATGLDFAEPLTIKLRIFMSRTALRFTFCC